MKKEYRLIKVVVKELWYKMTFFFVNNWIKSKFNGYWEMRQKCPEFAKNKYLLNAWNTYFENKNSFIHAGIQIEGIPCFPHHEVGVFISKEAKIGKNAVIFQHVTIGSNTLKDSNFGAPIIGDKLYRFWR